MIAHEYVRTCIQKAGKVSMAMFADVLNGIQVTLLLLQSNKISPLISQNTSGSVNDIKSISKIIIFDLQVYSKTCPKHAPKGHD